MELRGQRWIEGSGSGEKDMEGRQTNHEGHDKCSEYLESHAEGRISHGEGRAGGGLMRTFAAKDRHLGVFHNHRIASEAFGGYFWEEDIDYSYRRI